MKNIFCVLTLLIVLTSSSYAQKQTDTYSGAIGIQAYPFALTGKYDNGNSAVEGSLATNKSWQRMVGFYERENILSDDNSFKFVWGLGGDFMVLNPNWKENQGYYGSDGAIGIAAIIGLDKKIVNAPIDICASWQPNVNIYGINKAFVLNFAVAVRLAF